MKLETMCAMAQGHDFQSIHLNVDRGNQKSGVQNVR